MGDLGNNMDLPFEADNTGGVLHDEHVHYSGGLAVMAAVVPVPEIGPKPALIFRFATPLGDFYPPIVLVADDDQLAKLRPLLQAAIATARRAAKGTP